MKKFTVEISGAEMKRETEKAVLLDVTVDSQTGLKGVEVWFPKSQLKIDGEKYYTSEWMIGRKNDDILAKMDSFGILIA